MDYQAGLIRVSALAPQIRATAEVASATANVSRIQLLAQTAIAALTAAINAPSIDLSFQAQLIKAVALTGQFLKILNPIDALAMSDQTTITLSKAFEDLANIADQSAMTTGKAATDSAAATDQTLIEVIKALSDTVGLSDVKVVAMGKVLDEPVGVSELIAKALSTARADKFQFREGPGIDEYATGYFLEDYAYDGKPTITLIKSRADSAALTDQINNKVFGKNPNDPVALTETLSRYMSKSLTDSIGATDDFLGVANIDDDEYMTMKKGVSDTFVVGDAFARVVYYVRAFSDSAAMTDSATRQFGKGLQEIPALTDALANKTAKPLADSSAVTDLAAKGTFKGFADAGALADAVTKSANKGLSDSGALTDAAAARTGKVLSDSSVLTDAKAFALSRGAADSAATTDSVAKSVNPNKTDSAALTDSGSVRMQSYCDITYFTADYVGIQFTF